ncbi:MAG TPA: ACT domain-containing protein [Candidatus Fimivivens faecavium]|nr:ACT domain-containing protein [Candidatus Fimivivens faecavium]
MAIQQLSVFVENTPGSLAEITEVLAGENIDIRALSIADTSDFGILRLIVDRPEEARDALKGRGFTVSINDVIGIGVDDRPGGLSKALRLLGESGLVVEYLYAYVSRVDGLAYGILRMDDNAAAEKLLAENGFRELKN